MHMRLERHAICHRAETLQPRAGISRPVGTHGLPGTTPSRTPNMYLPTDTRRRHESSSLSGQGPPTPLTVNVDLNMAGGTKFSVIATVICNVVGHTR